MRGAESLDLGRVMIQEYKYIVCEVTQTQVEAKVQLLFSFSLVFLLAL